MGSEKNEIDIEKRKTERHKSSDIGVNVPTQGRSPGVVVMGGDSCSKDCRFESRYCLLDGHFFTLICSKNCFNVCLKRPSIDEKEAGVGHLFKKTLRTSKVLSQKLPLNNGKDIRRIENESQRYTLRIDVQKELKRK